MSDAGYSEHGESSALAQGAGTLSNNSLYVSDLDKDVSEPQIYKIFSKARLLDSSALRRLATFFEHPAVSDAVIRLHRFGYSLFYIEPN